MRKALCTAVVSLWDTPAFDGDRQKQDKALNPHDTLKFQVEFRVQSLRSLQMVCSAPWWTDWVSFHLKWPSLLMYGLTQFRFTWDGLGYSFMMWLYFDSPQTIFATLEIIDSVSPEWSEQITPERNTRASPEVNKLLPNGLNQHILNEQDQLIKRWNTLLLNGQERPLLCKLVSFAAPEWTRKISLVQVS